MKQTRINLLFIVSVMIVIFTPVKNSLQENDYVYANNKQSFDTNEFISVTTNYIKQINSIMNTTINNINNANFEETVIYSYEEYLNLLETTDNHLDWYIEYKAFAEQYSDILDIPTADKMYSDFTNEELQKLYGVVQAEVGDFGFEERCNVASVIFNRLYRDDFANSLSAILIPSQFATIKNGRYKKFTVVEETKLACEYVYLFGDTANGAIYFESRNSNVHKSYATLVEPKFKDNSGHKFYKKK